MLTFAFHGPVSAFVDPHVGVHADRDLSTVSVVVKNDLNNEREREREMG